MANLCIFVGEHDTTNVNLSVENICWMLKDEHNITVVTNGGARLSDNIKMSASIHHRSTPGYVGGFVSLNEYVYKKNVDIIIQVIEPTQHGLIVGTTAKIHNINCLYRYSGDVFSTHQIHSGWRVPVYYFLHNIIGKISLKLFNNYIVLGPTAKKILTNQGVSQHSIYVLPPPINSNRFHHKTAENDEISEPYKVLYLGGDRYVKGFDKLCEIIRQASSLDKKFEFVIAGSISDDTKIKQRENVTVRGYIDGDKIPEALYESDFLLLTSRKEGLPRVILEAFATKTPVIAPDVGEIGTVTDNIYSDLDEVKKILAEADQLTPESGEEYYRKNLKRKYNKVINEIV